ncbi:uncharacterized protein [Chelonus insularis]|uniref:uncharacterized protein n=1 Tax=Chelonus insularis TaxID=460826 RepID=UPI00158A13A2|nr:uncharacterized protein LOC118064553 [Chelonus insularis]
MGQLPADRVVPVQPFHTTEVDYASSSTLKMFQGRGAETYKGWIAVFVCFVTSAVHLELVSDYSTEAFIKAYRRFVSRRGTSSVLYSDCKANFKVADFLLKDLFRQSSSENAQLVSSLAQWRKAAYDIAVGFLVLLIEDNFPPAQWPLAQVVDVHPGQDGLVRVVSIKTSKTIFTRPITELIVLPVDEYRKDVEVDGEYVARD